MKRFRFRARCAEGASSDVYAALEAAAISAARANNAALWYIGRDLSGVFEDSAGTIPASVGAPVGLLRDRQYGVGNASGFHLSQATAAAKPVVVTLASGLLGWGLDGIDDHMPSTYRQLLGAGASTLIYSHDDSITGNSSFLFAESSSTSVAQLYSLAAFAAGTQDVRAFLRNDSNSAALNFVPYSVGGRAGAGVTAAVDSGTSIATYRNGASTITLPYSRSGSYTFNRLTLGASVRTSVQNFVGVRLGLVCSAPVAMSQADRQAIERFAAYLVGVAYAA